MLIFMDKAGNVACTRENRSKLPNFLFYKSACVYDPEKKEFLTNLGLDGRAREDRVVKQNEVNVSLLEILDSCAPNNCDGAIIPDIEVVYDESPRFQGKSWGLIKGFKARNGFSIMFGKETTC